MKKYIAPLVVFCVAVLLGIGTYFFFHKPVGTAHQIPSLRPRLGEVSPSAEFLNAQHAVEFYREEIRKHPNVVKNYVELAQLFMQEARVTGRHHDYIPEAQALLEEALKRDPNNFSALVNKASLLMTLHQFNEAKTIAQNVIQQNKYNAFIRGVLCDAHVELGEYADAVQACDAMVSIRPDLRSYARVSYLRELHGDLDGACAAMKMAADAGVPSQENRAWALYNLANLYLNMGKPDTAAYLYQGILQERPNYAYALSGLARVREVKGDHMGAIQLLVQATQSTPEHLFLEQLADVYRAMGQRESEKEMADKVISAFEQHEKEGWNIDREYAAFCLNHDIDPAGALHRAKKEYERRPNNIDALQTYAYALYKNGRASEAVPFVERAMRLNTKNALLHFQAGEIYEAAGQPDKATAFQQRSLQENPYIHTLYAGILPSAGMARTVSFH